MHKTKIYITIIYLLLFQFSFSQETRRNIDSLLNILETAEENSKVKILNEISRQYWNFSLDSSMYFANEALNLAHINQDQKGLSDAYNRIGNVYSYNKENKLALQYYIKCFDIRIKLGDSKGLSDIYNNFAAHYGSTNQHGIALEYYYKALEESKKRNDKVDILQYYEVIGGTFALVGDYKNSIKNLLKSLEIAKEINEEDAIASLFNNLGLVYQDISGYEEALGYFLSALEIYEKTNDLDGLSSVYNNLGIVYQSLDEIEHALEYYNKSLEIDLSLDSKYGQADAYNNIGTAYDVQGDKEKALEYYNKSLDLNNELDYPTGIATALNNIGLIYLDLGEYDKSYSKLRESTDLFKELNDIYSLANNYNNLANLFLRQNQYSKAQENLNQSIEISKKINTKEWLHESYELYTQLYTKQNNYKKALEYFKLYTEVNDSISLNKSTNLITEAKVKFETESLEIENELLKKDNQIQELDLNRQKNIKNYWIAFSFLIFALTLLGFMQFRLKIKTNNQLKETNKKLKTSEKNLKKLNATKDKFFSIISHDLKNPFQSLLGFSEALYNENDKLNKKEINEYSKVINESSQNLFDLLGNLLEWSKTQQGSLKLNPEQINIYHITNEVVDFVGLSVKKKKITIENLITKEESVYADKHVLSSILRNLISNAVKFTNLNGKIELSSFKSDDMIVISIKDNGKGISEENLEKLFKIDQGYSTRGTENESGTGLGLILCKELVLQSNGEIFVKSTLGQGSDFQFTLPLSSK